MSQIFKLFCALVSTSFIHASHSFFTPRQVTTDPVFELALTDHRIYHAPEDNHFELAVKPFYQQSNSPDRLAEYFLPGCKTCLSVRQTGSGDINPVWFNVISTPTALRPYSSTLTFAPERKTYGGVVTLFARHKKLWLLANTAAMGATHNMNGREFAISGSGVIPGFATMCAALNTCTWCAGKIPCCESVTRGGVDDIQIKIGIDAFRVERGHFAFYGVTTIPTGKRPTSEFMFEPLVGSKHWSVGGGINLDYVFHNGVDHQWTLWTDVKYRYVLRATERRSFDLCRNGDWSRYLQVATQALPFVSMPAINFFTRDVAVIPGSTIDAWFAVHDQFHTNWDFELGYNFWWRQQEHLSLCRSGELGVGIFDINGLCGGTPTSESTATISQSFGQVRSDATFTAVTPFDFNRNSAAHPTAWSNKVYAATAWHSSSHPSRTMLGFGGSYEFGNHAALNQWALWLNLTVDR